MSNYILRNTEKDPFQELLDSFEELKKMVQVSLEIPKNSPKKYVTVEEAVQILGLPTRQAVYTLISLGKIKSTKAGRRRYFSREDLENYILGTQKEVDIEE